jgi:hypothetical protein
MLVSYVEGVGARNGPLRTPGVVRVDQDLNADGRYLSTFSAVTTGAASLS